MLQVEPDWTGALALCEGVSGARALGFVECAASLDADRFQSLVRRVGADAWPSVVVTSEAEPVPFDADSDPLDDVPGTLPRSIARLAEPRRRHWTSICAAAGSTLLGIYPRLGSAPGAWVAVADGDQRQFVQLEPDGLSVARFVGARCRRLDVFAEDPAAHLFTRWIRDAGAEVLLCGTWSGLRGFGYELARSGRTWARIPELRCEGVELAPEQAALVGAGMHALGMLDPTAIPWVAPLAP